MRIVSIEIKNFGSYEGSTVFDTYETNSEKNIILIGGKNGAGKTTLFTAIRVCIYGCRSFGYQSINAFYIRHLYKLINNNSKLSLPAYSHVKVEFAINRGTDSDRYIINRSWVCEKISSVSERLTVIKNGIILSKIEMEDFEKFISQIIPPELFNLYFFDGEKIADFFLDEGGNHRLKNAFLTLCGYDTFEIMSKNFHRIANNIPNKNDIVEMYLMEKAAFSESTSLVDNLRSKIRELVRSIETIESNISALDTNYKKSGGVTQKEWDSKFEEIRSEEVQREEKNAWLKKIANDVLPFLILKEQLVDVRNQIFQEEQQEKVEYFLVQLQHEETLELFTHALSSNDVEINNEKLSRAISYIKQRMDENNNKVHSIFKLSSDQKAMVLHIISQVFAFDKQKIADQIEAIKKSIIRSQKIREELESCNIDTVNQYMDKRNSLLHERDVLIEDRFALEEELKIAEQKMISAETSYIKVRKSYEDVLKKDSISDISTKAIIMLDRLQEQLYTSQIEKMVNMFRLEINSLMRKTKFIDDIHIDDKFNIHIYRYDAYTGQQISTLLCTYGLDKLTMLIGRRAVDVIKALRPAKSMKSLQDIVSETETVKLPIEIDKNSLSNGEKQIFIMALYKSLVQLCNHEVPFVIDSPFARIDTEHRRNIVQHFFCSLKGQIFIFSTNEEVDQEHTELMKDKLLSTYTLKNDDNMFTIVTKGKYFGEM